ncbi:hypothetical protein F5Y16DRAFT_361517 [Xylariaceae sp. FL0255]|nr:hypothetical protein F5Y16DRAFT_361517 [Xylariaceae sp. FL0255]
MGSIVTLPIYEGVGIPLVVIATILVAARCWVNYHIAHGRLYLHDYMSIIGLTFLIITYAVNDTIIRTVSAQTLDLPFLFRLAIVIIILVQGTLWFSKAPILFLYVQLFGLHRWLRYISYLALSIAALVYIVGLIYTLVKCSTNHVTLEAYQVCAYSNTLVGVISGFISVVLDAIIFILPIPVIVGLKLEISKKIGLAVTFLSGILGIAASAIALYYKYQALSGDGTQLIAPIFFFTIEAFVAIAVGCAPAMRSFWKRYVVPKTVLSGPSSSYSHVLDNQPKPSRDPLGSVWDGTEIDTNRARSTSPLRANI